MEYEFTRGKTMTKDEMTIKFTGHKYITDKSRSTGFEQYLLIDTDYGDYSEIFGIDENTPLDLDAMLSQVYAEHGLSVTTERAMCGPNYAAIITDGRSPDSVVVWTCADFYLA
jgi:hypothetical protein